MSKVGMVDKEKTAKPNAGKDVTDLRSKIPLGAPIIEHWVTNGSPVAKGSSSEPMGVVNQW